MDFYSPVGQLFDGSVVNGYGEVQDFRIKHGPKGVRTCSFVPPLDVAMSDDPPTPCAVVASGRTFWIQPTQWGLDNGVPWLKGVVVREA
jgi:hypothetical protein